MKAVGSSHLLKRRRRPQLPWRVLLVVLGVSVMLIPFASRQYGEHQQRKLLKSWESVAPQNDSPVDVAMSELPVIEDEPVPLSAPELAENAADDLMRSGSAIGVLIIEDLEMRLPIIEDSTMQNLAVAPCHVQGTGLPGEYDNFVIAGHRSKTPGKNFNRLDELNIGDQACFVTQKGRSIMKLLESGW